MRQHTPRLAGVPERSQKTKELKATVQMLINFVEGGFRIAHIGARHGPKGARVRPGHHGRPPVALLTPAFPSTTPIIAGDGGKHVAGQLSAPLPPMEEVTRQNLWYDLMDAELMHRRSLGCPEVKELKNFTMWASCGSLPEDANPRSLRCALVMMMQARPPRLPVLCSAPYAPRHLARVPLMGGLLGLDTSLAGAAGAVAGAQVHPWAQHQRVDVQGRQRAPAEHQGHCGHPAARRALHPVLR